LLFAPANIAPGLYVSKESEIKSARRDGWHSLFAANTNISKEKKESRLLLQQPLTSEADRQTSAVDIYGQSCQWTLINATFYARSPVLSTLLRHKSTESVLHSRYSLSVMRK
jgi:hypothetical protein